jgi:hypothetical protein
MAENKENTISELLEETDSMTNSKKEAILAFKRLQNFFEVFSSKNSIVKRDEADDTPVKIDVFKDPAAKNPKVEKNRNVYTRKRYIDYVEAFLPVPIKVAQVDPTAKKPIITISQQSPDVYVVSPAKSSEIAAFNKLNPEYVFFNIDVPLEAETTPKRLADNKAKIDTIIAYYRNFIDDTRSKETFGIVKFEKKTIVFSSIGYGRALIGADPLTGELDPKKKATAPETFRYLSEELFKNFGYMNKNFMTKEEERAFKQRFQPATDDMVDALLNHCHITAAI